jgi:hypothetical protein
MMVSCHVHLYFHPETGWCTASVESYLFSATAEDDGNRDHNQRKQIEITPGDDIEAQVKGLVAEGVNRWRRLCLAIATL